MQKWFKSYGEPSGTRSLTRWKDWRSSSPFVQKVKCKFKVSYWVRSRLFLERHTWVRLDLQMVSACLFSQCQTFQDLVSISSCLVFVDLRKNLKLKLSSSLQGFPMVLSIASSWYWFTRLQKSYSTIHFDWIVFICVCKWCPKDERLDIGCHDFSPLDQCVSSKSLPVCPATWQQPKKDSEAVLIT